MPNSVYRVYECESEDFDDYLKDYTIEYGIYSTRELAESRIADALKEFPNAELQTGESRELPHRTARMYKVAPYDFRVFHIDVFVIDESVEIVDNG